MIDQLTAYIESPRYQLDLCATQQIWAGSEILGTAGIFMFLSYLTIPRLTTVQPIAGESRVHSMRMGLESEREKRFLLRLLGLSKENGWMGGIRNSRVRDMIVRLAGNHLQFAGMQPDYISYFASIIALSVLRVHATRSTHLQSELIARYWTYIQHALSLLGITLAAPTVVQADCESFISKYTSADEAGRRLLETLWNVYPGYMAKAMPVLFSQTRLIVISMLEELRDRVS